MLLLTTCILAFGLGCGEPDMEPPTRGAASTAPIDSSVRSPTVDPGRTQALRLVRRPLAIASPTTTGPSFQVRLRFNRKLPNKSGGANVDVILGDEAQGEVPTQPYGRRSRYCYVDVINDYDDPALVGANVGSRVPLIVRVRTQTVFRGRVTLQSRRRVGALHCGR